jgi:hypothetical protein
MDEAARRSAFLAAAGFAVAVVDDPAVGAAWNAPSALARMTVGDVAGHVFLVLRRVDRHLDEPVTADAPVARGWSFPRVDAPEDLDLDVHVDVRADGRHVAQWGWGDVAAACRDRVAKLAQRLPSETPSHVMLGGRAVPFAGYLGSRIVELLVHADDLACSVGIDLPVPPAAAVDVALAYLMEAARDAHGDLGVLRSLTRRERTPPGAPAVF